MPPDFEILIPEGWLIIAQRLNVGIAITWSQVPTGRLKSAVPSGLVLTNVKPNVETLGYYGLSLRDRHGLRSCTSVGPILSSRQRSTAPFPCAHKCGFDQ